MNLIRGPVIAIMILILASDLNADIARDVQVDSRQDTGTVNTQSLTVLGHDRYLTTGVAWRGGNTVSSVTYGGVNLTRTEGEEWSIAGTGKVDLWSLEDPAVGTADLVTTLSGSAPTGGFVVSAATYTGISGLGTIAKEGLDEKPMDVDIVTIGENSWVFSVGLMRDPLVVTEESPVFEFWNIVSVITTHWTYVGGDIPGPLTIGTHTPSWTYTQVVIQTAIIAAELLAINRLKIATAGSNTRVVIAGASQKEAF